MKPELPNLELLQYIAQNALVQDEKFIEAIKAKKESGQFYGLDFIIEVFPQMWGSTSTGFDVTPDGKPTVGGCAMTEAYTTIVHERVTDNYIVFFGNKPCYKIEDANQAFLDDKQKRCMASLSMAKKRY